jgi:hypothetical protein
MVAKKECSICGSEISEKAKKCLHCHHWVDGSTWVSRLKISLKKNVADTGIPETIKKKVNPRIKKHAPEVGGVIGEIIVGAAEGLVEIFVMIVKFLGELMFKVWEVLKIIIFFSLVAAIIIFLAKEIITSIPNYSEKNFIEYIPQDYQIYDLYRINIDSDKQDEAILLLEQSDTYQPEFDLRGLPVKIQLLDYDGGKWSAKTIETTSEYPRQHFLDDPLKLISKDDQMWIVLKSANGSYDGLAPGVTVFNYEEHSGLEQLISSDSALTGIIDKEDQIYLVSCNWYEYLEDPSVKVAIEVLDLTGEEPYTYEIPTDLTCVDLEAQLGATSYSFLEDFELLENVLQTNGVL